MPNYHLCRSCLQFIIWFRHYKLCYHCTIHFPLHSMSVCPRLHSKTFSFFLQVIVVVLFSLFLWPITPVVDSFALAALGPSNKHLYGRQRMFCAYSLTILLFLHIYLSFDPKDRLTKWTISVWTTASLAWAISAFLVSVIVDNTRVETFFYAYLLFASLFLVFVIVILKNPEHNITSNQQEGTLQANPC
jgi:hypothetical protein